MARVSLTLLVVRPDDQLLLTLQLDDVELTPPSAGQPREIAGTPEARLTVRFQPQHVAEEAFEQFSDDHQLPESGDEVPPPPGVARALLSGPSRLVFGVPPGATMPLTVEGVLDALQRLPLRVSAVNRWQPPGCLGRLLTRPPAVAPPAQTETAIEAPFRLMLSPHQQAHWRHALGPVVRGDWIELWHTRLGSGARGGDPELRAIWSPDFRADPAAPTPPDLFRSSLNGDDRNEIVHLTSNFRLGGFEPTPVDTERLMLSALGAWLKVEGSWEPPTGLSVENWRHEAMMGRDQYVRVVRRGHLFPFGHRAVLVKISERKFFFRRRAETPGHVAYLYQRRFILVREPTRTYAPRDMPLRTVTVKTRVTPNLDVDSGEVASLGDGAFWPRVVVGNERRDFQFHLQGVDWEGRSVEWSTPLIFVSKEVDENGGQLAQVLTEYNTAHAVEDERRWRRFGGQTVAFAPSSKPGDTGFETAQMSFAGVERSGGAPRFRPAMARAAVDVPAVRQLLGKSVPSRIEWEPSYLAASGNAIGNAGDVFVRLVPGTEPKLEFDTEKAGGMVAPNLDVSGLSRSLGPVGGAVDKMVIGEFRPEEIFPGVKLLGGIDLFDVVKMLDFDAAGTTETLPGLTTERAGNLVRTRYRWKIGRGEMVDGGPLFQPQTNAELSLEAVVDAPLDGSPPSFEVRGSLTHFKVVLLEDPTLVELTFDSVSFVALPGKKPDVAVQLAGIEFKGILEFVRKLQEVLPLDGFNDPPNLTIVTAPVPGIEVGFSFGIPDVAVGAMSIQNMTLAAGVFLPFGDAPLNFHFAFCERQQPFVLTVMIFGGGGFFAIDIGIDGVQMIEAALEFGLSAAINLGVASGKASMTAGFYFQAAGDDFELTGYFRAYGELSVLGIITVSLEFYLGLTYASKGKTPHGGKLWGQAKVTVKIEILFFSISVGVSCERAFAGSDPKFRDVLTSGDWSAYAAAFADYP